MNYYILKHIFQTSAWEITAKSHSKNSLLFTKLYWDYFEKCYWDIENKNLTFNLE